MYYPHWSVGNSHQEDEPAPLVVDSSGTTPASVDADGTSTLPVNTAGTSAASQGAHLSVNTCVLCLLWSRGCCRYLDRTLPFKHGQTFTSAVPDGAISSYDTALLWIL